MIVDFESFIDPQLIPDDLNTKKIKTFVSENNEKKIEKYSTNDLCNWCKFYPNPGRIVL